MIAVDTSALVEILLAKPGAEACMDAIEAKPEVKISTGTVAEVLVVACRRKIGVAMLSFIERLDFQIMPVTGVSAIRIAEAYDFGEREPIWLA